MQSYQHVKIPADRLVDERPVQRAVHEYRAVGGGVVDHVPGRVGIARHPPRRPRQRLEGGAADQGESRNDAERAG